MLNLIIGELIKIINTFAKILKIILSGKSAFGKI